MFTSSGRVSVRREASDGDDRDKGIAQAISEERSIARWGFAAERKLTEEVNMANLECCSTHAFLYANF